MSSQPEADTSAVGSTRGRWWSPIILIAAMIALFLVVAAIGAGNAARDERVLPFLTQAVEIERTWGWQTVMWLFANGTRVGQVTSGVTAAIALLGLIVGRRRGLPLLVLAASVCSAAWGQILLFGDRPELGAWLYGCGVVGAVVLGAWRPITRLPGFPQLPRLDGGVQTSAEPGVAPRRAHRLEYVLVLALTALALFTRLYALTELPQGVDLELIDFQISSRTAFGFGQYLTSEFLTNGAGVVTQLTQMLLFQVFGTSLYTLRLAAVCWGVAAVPLLYWLVRRMAGVSAAVVATLLLITAPDQLFWSRTENTHFSAIAVLALVTAHVGLWMVERFSVVAVLATALWMPACRYFYTPGMVMFTYPIGLFASALLFVRGAWRKAWYVAPLLAGGVALWIFSLSILYSGLDDWHWRFVHPAWVHGAPAWRKQGEESFRAASVAELVRLQGTTMATNLGRVVAGFTYHEPLMFSHFYQRSCASQNHLTALNAAVAVMFALGLGYLLGQCYERRAFVLLLWVAVGLLPAIMSNEPSPRRLSLIFPALYAIAGLMLVTVWRLVRSCSGRWVAWLTTVPLSLVVTGVMWTSLASHFLVSTGPAFFSSPMRFAKPLFKQSNLIFHNMPTGAAKAVLFGNLDEFLASTVCYHYVGEKEWLAAALDPQCAFNEEAFRMTRPSERLDVERATYRPQRISYLLEDSTYSRPHIDLLRHLYPAAELRREGDLSYQRNLVSLTVDIADVQALHRPILLRGPEVGDVTDLETRLLDGVPLTRAQLTGDEAIAGSSLTIRGGIFVESDGWYRFEIQPDCADARMTIDQQPTSRTDALPMLAGTHPFEVVLPNAAACRLPLRVLMQTADQPAPIPIGTDQFVNPAVVAAVPAAPVAPYPGFNEARVFASVSGHLGDLGVDGQGFVSVLLVERGVVQVQRLDANGHEVARWFPAIPPGRSIHSMAVAPDGTTVIMTEIVALLYDPAGHPTGSWQPPWGGVSTDIALAPDGRVVLAIPSRESIAVFGRDGRLQGEIREFVGGPGRFSQPASVTISPDGGMVVIQDDGRALIFANSGNLLQPTFVSMFQVDFSSVPIFARGCAFDGDRLLFPDPSKSPRVYNKEGQRLMASLPVHDLAVLGVGPAVRLRFAGNRLYALDGLSNRVWSITR